MKLFDILTWKKLDFEHKQQACVQFADDYEKSMKKSFFTHAMITLSYSFALGSLQGQV